MLDIKRTTVSYVEARRITHGAIGGININIQLEDVLVRGQEIEITFKYTVDYSEKVGSLIMRGKLLAGGALEECQGVSREWTNKHKLPHDFAEDVLNTINYVCGTNGTLAVRAVNLSPPLVPPRITVTDEGGKTSPEKKS